MKVKGIWKAAVYFGIGVFLAAAPANTINAAAASNGAAQDEEVTYTITYRPGKIGSFAGFAERCQAYGTVDVSARTGSVKVVIPAGGAYPEFPGPGDIQIKPEYDGKYMVNPDYDPTSGISTVTENGDYVVDYVAIVDQVEYSVRFVDEESGEDIAVPVITQGNINMTVSYPEVSQIGSYRLTQAAGPITLTGDATLNVLTFLYKDTTEPVVTTITKPGKIVEQVVPQGTTTVVVPGSGSDGSSSAGGRSTGSGSASQTSADEETGQSTESEAAAQSSEDETDTALQAGNTESGQETEELQARIQVIPEEELTLTAKPTGSSTEPASETVKDSAAESGDTEGNTAGDEEVPKAESALDDNKPGRIWVVAGIGAAVGLIGAGAFLLRRKWK